MNSKPTYISTATTTVCHSKKGKLAGIVVTGGTAGTIVGYNNASTASGDVLFSFDSTNALKDYNFFGAEFQKGLVVVTGGATKLTVLTTD
jgi:hypothetical protein